MSAKHQWAFQSRFRANAYGWKGSKLAVERLKEAVSEIQQVGKTDPLIAADGAIYLFTRFWPALQRIDSSSGALGSAVHWTQSTLLPLVIAAPAERSIRERWLERLWAAIEEDGVDYLATVQDHWGELCGGADLACIWADRFVELVRGALRDRKAGGYSGATSVCLSSLLGAGRHEEIFELLGLLRFPFWDYRKFGVAALEKEGRLEDALQFAEASRGLNQPDLVISAACERLLLEAERREEAYALYALVANEAATGLATFRAIARKYPEIEQERILLDLAQSTGVPGRFFAAAKDAGLYSLALRFAGEGRTDLRTLSRAARDFKVKAPEFAMQVGWMAVEGMLAGQGFDVVEADVVEAYERYVAAAEQLGLRVEASGRAVDLARRPGKSAAGRTLAESLLRASGAGVF